MHGVSCVSTSKGNRRTDNVQYIGRDDEENGEVDARSRKVDQVWEGGEARVSSYMASDTDERNIQPMTKPTRIPQMAASGIDLAD